MSSVEQLYQGIISAVNAAYSTAGLSPQVGLDWPPLVALQSVSKGGGPLVSIFDRGAIGAKNVTKCVFLSPVQPANYGVTGGTLTTASTEISAASPATLIGSGTPLVNDCFFVVINPVGKNVIIEYICTGSDTLITALTALTAQINSSATGLSATFDGVHTVTVTASSGFGIEPIRAGVVNVGGYIQEIYRQDREIQVTLWTQTPEDRAAYGVVLENLFAQLEVNFGLTLADQSRARIMLLNDFVQKDSQLQDIYRRDFIISANYPVTQNVQAWIVESIAETFVGET